MITMKPKDCASVALLIAALSLQTELIAQPLQQDKKSELNACVKRKNGNISKADINAQKLLFEKFKAGKIGWAEVESPVVKECRTQLGIAAPPPPKLQK